MHTSEIEPVDSLSFEQALAELETTVRLLETGGQPLEELVCLYQRGRALTEHCQHLLDEVELRIVRLSPDGSVEPFAPLVVLEAV